MPSAKEIESTERLLNFIREGEPSPSVSISQANSQQAPRREKVSPRKFSFLNFTTTKKACTAVAIGGKALLVATTTCRRGRHTFQDLRSFAYPPDLSTDSPAFPGFLQTCLKKVGAGSSKNIWTFVNTDVVEFAPIKLPDVPSRDLHQSLLWAVRKEKKITESTHVLEYRILDRVMDKGVQKRLAVYFLVPITEIQRIQKLFKQADCILSGISIEPMAIQNYFLNQWILEPKDVVAHLHIGEDNSRIDIIDHDRLLFSRNIKSGANSFIQSIREGLDTESEEFILNGWPQGATSEAEASDQMLQVEGDSKPSPGPDPADAEKLFLSRIEAGRARTAGGQTPSAGELLEMFLPSLERLSRQLERTLEFYANNMGFAPVEKILVSGVPVLFPGVKEYLAGQFSIPVVLFDPLDTHPVPQSAGMPLSVRSRMEMLHVAGLAMSSNEGTINALHTYVQRFTSRADTLITKVAGIVVILLLAAVAGFHRHSSATLELLREDIRKEEIRLHALELFPDAQGLTMLFAEARDKDARIKAYLHRYRPMAVMSALTGVTPVWAGLQSASFRFHESQEDMAQAGEGTVRGLVTGPLETLDAYLGSYILMLGDSPVFTTPRLVSKDRAGRAPGEAALEFNISLKIQ